MVDLTSIVFDTDGRKFISIDGRVVVLPSRLSNLEVFVSRVAHSTYEYVQRDNELATDVQDQIREYAGKIGANAYEEIYRSETKGEGATQFSSNLVKGVIFYRIGGLEEPNYRSRHSKKRRF